MPWARKAENLERAWAHYQARETVLSSLPFKAIVELTQNCNFKCGMCAQAWDSRFAKYRPDFNMPMETFVAVAEQLFPAATMIDLRGFGETTILPHWPEVVDYLAGYPFIEWNLITNLSLPRADVWDKMVRLGFRIGFSCDGATRETYETLRAGGDWALTRRNLAIVSDAIKTHQSGLIYFLSTIQKSNAHELRALVELAHEFAVPEVQFKIVRGSDARGTDLEGELRALGAPALGRFADEAIAAGAELGVRVTFNDPIFSARVAPPLRIRLPTRLTPSQEARLEDTFRIAVNQRCFKPFSFAYINYAGEMGTCNHMMFPDMLVMGDLRRESLAEIWNAPAYRRFRRELLDAKPSDERCQWCFAHRQED